MLERVLNPLAFKSSVLVLRCVNNVLGGMSFVVLARLTGAQSVGGEQKENEVALIAEKEKLESEREEGLQNNQSTAPSK